MLTKYRHNDPVSSVVGYPTFSSSTTAPVAAVPTRKRTHLKPSQVAVLQESFVTNPLPDAAIRGRLARDLGVTERTIQIWFQNRRAKARKLDAMSGSFRKTGPDGNKVPCLMPNVRTGWIEPPCHTGAPHQRYQATFRTMMTPERFEELHNNNNTEDCSSATKRRPRSASKPEQLNKHVDFDVPMTTRAVSEGMADRWMPKQGMANHHNTVSFPTTALRIGSWSRFTSAMNNSPSWDLMCFAQDRQLVWQIQDGGHQFRISIDLDGIQQLVLTTEMTTGDVSDDNAMVMVDQLAIQLYQPGDVTFSMWRNGLDHDWIRCGDFSENKQASFQSVHVLQGVSLRPALLQLFGMAPDLFEKCTMDNNPPPMDLASSSSCPPRSFTSSPSATPEPFSATSASTTPTACWMNAAAAAAAAAAAESFLSKPMVDWAWQQQQQQQQRHSQQHWSAIVATGAVAPPSIAFASPQENALGHLM